MMKKAKKRMDCPSVVAKAMLSKRRTERPLAGRLRRVVGAVAVSSALLLGAAATATVLVILPGLAQAQSVASPPTNLRAEADDTQVRLSWGLPTTTKDDLPPHSWEYRYRERGGTWPTAWQTREAFYHTVTVSNLTNGTAYDFQVRAVIESESGQAAETSAAPGKPPGAPQNFEARGIDGEVVLTWQAPTDTGGFPIIRYEYRYADSDTIIQAGDPWTNAGTDLTETVRNLENGTQYSFELRAVSSFTTQVENADGELETVGGQGETVFASGNPFQAPSATSASPPRWRPAPC